MDITPCHFPVQTIKLIKKSGFSEQIAWKMDYAAGQKMIAAKHSCHD